MAVNKIGSFAPGDENLNNLMENANLQAIGNDKITADAVTNIVYAGSIFESGGSYYEVVSNTAITGTRTNPVHVYFNPSTLVFSYSTTVPTYNNTLQGYYNGTSKCLMRGDITGLQQLEKPTVKISETIYNGCNLLIKSEGEISIDPGGEINSRGSLNVNSNGDIIINDGGDIIVNDGGDIEINSGGGINVESGGTITCAAGSSASFSGTITCAAGSSASFSGRMKIPTGTAAPASPVAGNMYFDTSTNRIYIYNGSAWRHAITT